MYEEAKELWQQTIQESIEYRGLHLLNSLNFASRVNQEIALDAKQSAKDRIEASINVVNAQEALFSVMKYGPDVLKHTNWISG